MTKPLAALLALAALAPLAVEAQAGEALGSPDPTVTVPEPPAGLDPELAAMRADEAPADDGPGLGASWGHATAGFGIGAGAGGVVGGVVVGLAACSDFASDLGGLCILLGFAGAGLGAAAVAPFGAALGAWGFGEQRGGTGNFFAALGGSYLGAGLGVGVAALLGSVPDLASYGAVLGPIVGSILSTLGAALGYQLSSSGHRAGPAQAAGGPTLVPMLDVSPAHAVAGLAGTF